MVLATASRLAGLAELGKYYRCSCSFKTGRPWTKSSSKIHSSHGPERRMADLGEYNDYTKKWNQRTEDGRATEICAVIMKTRVHATHRADVDNGFSLGTWWKFDKNTANSLFGCISPFPVVTQITYQTSEAMTDRSINRNVHHWTIVAVQ